MRYAVSFLTLVLILTSLVIVVEKRKMSNFVGSFNHVAKLSDGHTKLLMDSKELIIHTRDCKNIADQRIELSMVFGQKGEVVAPLVTGDVLFFLHRSRREVDFAAEDRLDPRTLAGLEEVDGAEEVAVICHGHSGHFQLYRTGDEILDPDSAIEQRILGVLVEVDEGIGVGSGHGQGQETPASRRYPHPSPPRTTESILRIQNAKIRSQDQPFG